MPQIHFTLHLILILILILTLNLNLNLNLNLCTPILPKCRFGSMRWISRLKFSRFHNRFRRKKIMHLLRKSEELPKVFLPIFLKDLEEVEIRKR